MKKSENNNISLLRSLKKGDQKAFKIIFSRYEKKLYYFIFSIAKSDYVAEEILQEVFIKVWDIKETIDPSKSFSSFIYTIARNLTYNHLRKIANQENLKEELWNNLTYIDQQTENDILFKEYKNIVDDILDGLPAQKKAIFIMSKQEGKSNQEIADLLSISPKTVKNHLWKTLQIIRQQLQPHIKIIATNVILNSSFFFS